MSVDNLKKRIGKFYITKHLLDDVIIEDFSEILSDMLFIPLRVEFIYFYNKFEMVGVSKYFEILDDGLEIPTYDITLTWDDINGTHIDNIKKL